MGFQPMNHRQDADATKPHGQDARNPSYTPSEVLTPVPDDGSLARDRRVSVGLSRSRR
jgi:hypothetical protein